MLVTELIPAIDIQAGGGGSFGGGGGGGGGDGDGIFYLVYWLIRLAIEYPPIGVPLLIGAVVIFSMGSKRGWWKHQERTIRRSRTRRRVHASAVSADGLRASDPAFDEQRFLARVGVAFDKAQSSWCAQQLEELRPFVSDGVFERFSLQVEEQVEDGWRQELKGLARLELTIAHVEAGTHFDTVTVRVPFRADIYRVSLETGKRIAGSQLPRNIFTEYWSFLRRRGAKSISGAGLIEGKCPNCGAELEMNQSARCTHCDCLARSGQFDWVLAEITQASAWRPEREADIPGLASYAAGDSGLNVQMLEDQASVAFWRKCAADRRGTTEPLARVADADLVERYAERFVPNQDQERHYMGECAVGSVRTLGFLTGAKEDRAVVEVVWDGLPARVGADGGRRLEKRRQLRRTLLLFARKAGQQTRLDDAFTTAHCGNCGAHDTGGTDPTCPYCGAARSGDPTTWLLRDLVPAAKAHELLAELQDVRRVRPPQAAPLPSRTGLLAWAAELVRADGVVDETERRALRALGKHGEMSGEEVDELIEQALDGSVDSPANKDEAGSWLASLVKLALVDGALSMRERRVLRRAAERLSVGRSELAKEIQAARKELYRESRAANRFARAQRSRSSEG